MSIKFSQLPTQSSITGTTLVPIIGAGSISYKTTIDNIGTYLLTAPTLTGGSINGAPIGVTNPSTGKFISLAMPTDTSTALLEKNSGITTWVYSGKSKSIASEESVASGLSFNSTGTKMFVAGSTGDDINEYNLSSAWDVTTATYSTVFSIAGQDSAQSAIHFKPDGTGFYVLGDTNNTVFQYSLGTPWSIATATYDSKSFSVSAQESNPSAVWFRPDGTEMYVAGYATDAIYKYILATPWDVSTAYYPGTSFSIASQETGVNALVFDASGSNFYILGSTGDDVNHYSLSTPWDITTATFVGKFWIGAQEGTSTALYIAFAQNKAFVLGSSADTVFEYTTVTSSLKLTADNVLLTGNVRSNSNLTVDNNFYVEGASWFNGTVYTNALTVVGTFTASSTINLTGATTSTTSIATSATTGTVVIGGVSQTGAITVGQSTGAQTLNLATGATTNGTTKTVNIGTAGVSGSTTNVVIGSATSGALGSLTVNSGKTIYSISPSITATGTQQNEALLLTSVINNVTGSVVGANGVLLPVAVAGARILIRNSDVSDALLIYPQVGSQINTLGTNIAYSLPAGEAIEFFASSTTQWLSC